MFAQVLTMIVWTLLGALGYTVLYGRLESYSASRAAKSHNVGQFQQTFPLVIGVSALMLTMRGDEHCSQQPRYRDVLDLDQLAAVDDHVHRFDDR